MITPSQIPNPYVKPRWQAPVGVMESVVAYNCRKYGMPRPVLAMPMWEGAGNLVFDYSGHGKYGTNNGADWVANGLSFVAANSDYVTIPQSVIFSSDFTISFWEFSEAGSNTGYFCGDSSDPLNFLFRKWGTVQYTGYIGDVIFPAFSVQRGVWNHNIITHSGGTSYWYVNNVLKRSLSGSNFSGLNSNLYLGNRADLTRDLDGTLNNVSVYNTVLTAAQRKLLYDNPYFMYRMPEELYGYAAAAAGVSIPVFMHHYNQLRGA